MFIRSRMRSQVPADANWMCVTGDTGQSVRAFRPTALVGDTQGQSIRRKYSENLTDVKSKYRHWVSVAGLAGPLLVVAVDSRAVIPRSDLG